MQVKYAFDFDGSGRTATTTEDAHVREMIEQVLFTAPGERVMRPTFGSGVLQLVFAPNGTVLADATQFLVQSALQEWLADIIVVDAVEVSAEDSTLNVTVVYTVKKSGRRMVAELQRGLP